jgi:hypothetical protein
MDTELSGTLVSLIEKCEKADQESLSVYAKVVAYFHNSPTHMVTSLEAFATLERGIVQLEDKKNEVNSGLLLPVVEKCDMLKKYRPTRGTELRESAFKEARLLVELFREKEKMLEEAAMGARREIYLGIVRQRDSSRFFGPFRLRRDSCCCFAFCPMKLRPRFGERKFGKAEPSDDSMAACTMLRCGEEIAAQVRVSREGVSILFPGAKLGVLSCEDLTAVIPCDFLHSPIAVHLLQRNGDSYFLC